MNTHAARALQQAKSINSRRLAVLLCSVGAMGVVRLVIYPVPDAVFLLFGFWLLAAMLYDIWMPRLARLMRAQTMQATMFAVDISLLTVLCREFLGIQTLEGHYWFAVAAAVFGTMMIIAGVFFQDSPVTHTHESVEPLRTNEDQLRGTGTILLVDEEVPVREASARLLARAGYSVVEAQDGHRALKLFDRDPDQFDAVVTDMMMPGIDGRELARRVRLVRPAMPVVFMSGYTEDDERQSLLDTTSVFVEKPFTPEVFLSKVKQALGTAHKMAQSA